MGKIQIKRGLANNLPNSADAGELLFTTDEKNLYVGNGSGTALTKVLNAGNVNDLIDSKITANAGHTHTSTSITDFNTAVETIITGKKNVANGILGLDANGLIPVSAIPTSFKEANVVSNIAERDELETFEGLHALVLDATADTTVAEGGAEYVYSGVNWVKIAELETIDALIDWANIQNKPSLATKFTDLSDTPSSLSGNGGKLLAVNAAGTGLEFITVDIDGGTF